MTSRPKPAESKPLRADARRNRTRVLEVAAEIFAAEGLSVPVHEIARRAGVGTGTVSRHFRTKEDLFAAILLSRMQELAAQADTLREENDPGAAFFTFFAALVRAGAAHRGLAESLAGTGYDVEVAGQRAGYDVSGKLRDLLAQAQRSGAVRSDVDYADVKALMVSAQAREGASRDSALLDPLIAVISQGLRT